MRGRFGELMAKIAFLQDKTCFDHIMSAAEIKIGLFRDIDRLPEQYLPGLQAMIQIYLAKIPPTPKPARNLGVMKGLVLYMAPDFNAPLEDFAPYMA